MSIIVRPILDALRESDRRKAASGHPTGSRLGDCTAKLQMLRFPSVTKPEKPNPRALLTWEQGDRIEEWLAGKLKQVYPDAVGLRQETFYIALPLADDAQVAHIAGNIARRYGEDGALWGRVIDGFQPPTIRINPETNRLAMRLLTRDREGRPPRIGFVLDTKTRVLWIPTALDFVLRHPEFGLTVVECKAVSDFTFRRLVAGKVDYQKACQLAGMGEATGANVMIFAYRNETGHMAEILYLREGPREIRVQLTAPNGSAEVFFVHGDKLQPEKGAEGDPIEIDFPPDATFEAAEVWTPWDPRYLTDIRARVLAALLWAPGEPVTREYGPVFTCAKCDGRGKVTCSTCKGTGETAKLKKVCGPCQGAKLVACKECDGRGTHPEVALPAFPCGYCPVVGTCWEQAGVRLELGKKPVYYVQAEPYLAAKLSFTSPIDYAAEALTPEADPATFALETQEASA